jgi:hypothetical protein
MAEVSQGEDDLAQVMEVLLTVQTTSLRDPGQGARPGGSHAFIDRLDQLFPHVGALRDLLDDLPIENVPAEAFTHHSRQSSASATALAGDQEAGSVGGGTESILSLEVVFLIQASAEFTEFNLPGYQLLQV